MDDEFSNYTLPPRLCPPNLARPPRQAPYVAPHCAALPRSTAAAMGGINIQRAVQANLQRYHRAERGPLAPHAEREAGISTSQATPLAGERLGGQTRSGQA